MSLYKVSHRLLGKGITKKSKSITKYKKKKPINKSVRIKT